MQLAVLTVSFVLTGAVVNRFSTNAICRQHNCVNPVFPGLQDFSQLKTLTWTCPDPAVKQSLEFCSGAVQHRVALGSADVKTLEEMASTAYFYHLSGMKMDPWDFREPSKHSDNCVQAIWHLVCSTYLPKAPVNCQKGEVVPYLLPCHSECRNYVDACNVECCDESAQCSPGEGVKFAPPFENFTGYSAASAPSMQCTGSGANAAGPSLLILLLSLAAGDSLRRPALVLGALAAAMSLQGCDIMATHSTGTWESRSNYMVDLSVKTTEVEESNGTPRITSKSVLNSCSTPGLEDSQKCGGHGVCTEYAAGLSFCQCSTGWTGPECRGGAKSQRTAFLLSLFTGFLGLDRFYLGELSAGTLKLSTLGGFGVWWLWDIIRIGSAPILTREHGRLAADLPHFLFVILAVLWAALLGYFIFGVVGAMWHESRILNRALDKVEKITNHLAKHRYIAQSEDMEGMPTKSTFRVAAPLGHRDFYGSMAESPPEVKLAAYKNEMSPFFLYAKASEQPTVKSSGAFSRSLGSAPQ